MISFYTICFLPLLMFMHNTVYPEKVYPKTITVIVHGTKAPSFIANTFGIAHKFFYTPSGLNKGVTIGSGYRFGKLIKNLHEADPELFPLEDIYLFGWNGNIHPAERYMAAETLYQELKTLLSSLPHHAKVRVVTHSHGGNVVLNMAHIQKSKPVKVIIDELVLLGCPVQETTSPCLCDPMFKKVVSLYSTNDILQVIDPQGIYQWNRWSQKMNSIFSGRTFNPHKKMVQSRIKNGNYDILHIDFIRTPFIRNLGSIIRKINNNWNWFDIENPNNNIIELDQSLV